MIDAKELRQLPLSELQGIRTHMRMLRVPEQYSKELTPHELYVYISANEELGWEVVTSILQQNQPQEILALLVGNTSKVAEYLLDNPLNANIWTVFSFFRPITLDHLARLFSLYFDPYGLLKHIDAESRDGQAQSLRKSIFFCIKNAIKSGRVDHSGAVTAFQQHYLRLEAQPITVEDTLKLIEMIFATHPYRVNGLLENSSRLKQDILEGMIDNNSPFASLLSINIYGEMCKLFEGQSNYTQTFIDLYHTLGSYGVHLIKDVWGSISLIVNSKPALKYIPAEKLLEVLILRVWKHKNDNVPKHCVRDFLKSPSIDRLVFLRSYQHVAYGTLTQMLNSGQFYQDAPLLMDSSFYRYISTFFCMAYNQMPDEQLTQHLKLFVSSVVEWIDYDQALPAFLLVFKNLKRRVRFYGKKELEMSVRLLKKIYYNLHVRKRWQVVDCLLECLRHLSSDVSCQDLLGLVGALPNEAYGWAFIHDKDVLEQPGDNLLDKYNALYTGDKHRPTHDTLLIRQRLEYTFRHYFTPQALQGLAKSLTEKAFAEFQLVDLYYKLLFILQLPFPQLSEHIEQLARSCYSNPLKMRITLRHLQLQLTRPQRQLKYPPNQTLSLISDYVTRCEQEQHFNHQHVIHTTELFCRHLLIQTSEATGQHAMHSGRKDLAQFTEWAVDAIIHPVGDKYAFMLNILLVVLKCHVAVPQRQYLIQDCLYTLYSSLPTLKEVKGMKLRVELFLSMALTNDRTFTANPLLQGFLEQPVELIDRYDYRQFPQLTIFLRRQYIPYALANNKQRQIDEVQRILKRSLVSNLQYSMQKNEILCYTDFIFDERLLSDPVLLQEGLVDSWVAEALKVGKDSLVIKRPAIDSVYIAISSNYQKLVEGKLLSKFAGVVLQMARLEEYRGFDGQILFSEEEHGCQEIMALRRKIPPMSEYYGAYPRYLFMGFVDRVARKEQLNIEEKAFLQNIIKQVIKVSLLDDSANKMMFTQPFREKLRSWQLLQATLPFVCRDQALYDWVFSHLDKIIQQTNQPQIKYYMELFATRVLLSQPERSLQFVLPKLKESGNSLNNSITYVILAGLLLQRFFSREVYNVLLTYICANTAYLRGLAQYFCFYNYESLQPELKQSWVIHGLYQQYLSNPDSVRLVSRLNILLNGYRERINGWSFQFYCGLYMDKTGETIQEYHMETLKQIGLDIVQEIKEQDQEFLTFKEIWKREAVLPKHQANSSAEKPKSFQRKIDPILEDVYDYNDKVAAKTKLRILGSNLKNLDNYGHLVRTSEIFSVEELAMHDIGILEDEKFRSVSCTGEKWLNIVEVRRENSMKYVLRCIQQGYQVAVIEQSSQQSAIPIKTCIPQKCLLIVGDEDGHLSNIYREAASLRVQLGRDLSVHVQVAIFIWEYVKQHLLQK